MWSAVGHRGNRGFFFFTARSLVGSNFLLHNQKGVCVCDVFVLQVTCENTRARRTRILLLKHTSGGWGSANNRSLLLVPAKNLH